MKSKAAYPYIFWMSVFVVVPLLLIVFYAFTTADGSFTLSNFANIEIYTRVFGNSFWLALVATVICLIIAYPFAYLLAQESPVFRKIAMLFIMVPMWMNFLLRTYAWMSILENNGFLNQFLRLLGLPGVDLINSEAAVILGMVYNFLPFMILPIHSVISKMDVRHIEAAADLGCNGFLTLTRVILPMSTSGIISGITMVFVPSISTFYISQKLGGGTFDLIGDTIERQFQNPVTYNVGAAISLVMMILILISMAVMNRFSDDEGTVIV